jgi:hypothetical protein
VGEGWRVCQKERMERKKVLGKMIKEVHEDDGILNETGSCGF